MAGKVRNNLIGKKFGRLTVIRRADRIPGDRGAVRWTCECECGNVKEIISTSLTTGRTKSCGCLASAINSAKNIAKNTADGVYDDISGQRFGRLVVLGYIHKKNGIKTRLHVRCICDCGKEVEIAKRPVVKGVTKSCGCINIEMSTARVTAAANKARIDGTDINLIKGTSANKSNLLGVRGVSLKNGKYVARITFKKKTYYLGAFDTIDEAISSRKRAESELFAPFLEQVNDMV